MEIIELSKKLGEALRNSDVFKAYVKAQDDCKNDSALEAKINEFKIQKKIYDLESEKEEVDADVVAVIKDRLDTLYEEIYSTDIMKAFTAAEDELNILLNAVNMTITSYISTQSPSSQGGCTHDCSSCSAGCSGH